MPAETIVGMHVADLLGMESFEQMAKAYLDRCFAGEEVSYADWLTTPLGRRYSAVTYSPLRSESERVEAALVIIRDLTEHMLASEALREAQMELAHVNRVTTMGQLTASITHEVNQPITAAAANAQAALRWLHARPPDLEEVRQALARIVKNAMRAGDVVGRIRELIKKAPPRKDSVDINEAIREVIELTRSEAAKTGVSVRTQLAEGLPPVQGDRVQLQQVLLNLIINAIEAMRDVGEEERELLISTVTNRMACQSRCEIRVQASRRRVSSACSRLSTPRNRAVWGLGCRSAGQLSKRITDDCGRARTCPAAPAFNSPCRRSQTLRRDAALVSRPKEQATRPRVLLWVTSGSRGYVRV